MAVYPNNQTQLGGGAPVSIGSANAEGSAISAARLDHVHAQALTWEKIADVTAGSAVTDLDISTTLNGDSDVMYELVVFGMIDNNTNISLQWNTLEFTASETIEAEDLTVEGGNPAKFLLFQTAITTSNNPSIARCTVFAKKESKIVTGLSFVRRLGSAPTVFLSGAASVDTTTNITSLRLHATSANAILAGTRAILFKVV